MRRALSTARLPRSVLRALAMLAALGVALLLAVAPVRAQGVELGALDLRRSADNGLTLDFSTRLTLSRAMEDALQRGVPLYFVAQATVFRGRWYWRDERVSRVTRNWRLAYQPLTGTWRVSLGVLGQSHASLGEALAVVSRVGGWRLAEPGALEAGERYYVEFSYRLDTAQLPRPMQFGAGNDWALAVERTLTVE